MPERPNVLVLMCDHHRFDALGCLGNPMARTPNLDRLAASSVRFDRCYTQSPVCSPARHSLATGRYAHAHGVITNQSMPRSGMTTVAHALKPLGYRRFHVGHMHWRDPEVDNGYEPLVSFKDWHDTMPERVQKRWEWEAQGVTRRTTAGPSPRAREEYQGHYVAGQAVARIEEAARNDERFLCWASFPEPHPPFFPPKEIYESFDQSKFALPEQAPKEAGPPHRLILEKRKEWEHLTETEVRQMLAGYYGMITLVDGFCGTVLDSLERLGIADDTVVIWTVDHGDQLWEHEMFLKFCMYEASVHVPLLVRAPGATPGVRDEFVEHVDLCQTICELTGAEPPGTVQGRSLAPLLGGEPAPTDWRDAVFSQIGGLQMIRTLEWKLNVYDGEPGELYNMQADPNEFDNLITSADAEPTVTELLARLEAWEAANAPGA